LVFLQRRATILGPGRAQAAAVAREFEARDAANRATATKAVRLLLLLRVGSASSSSSCAEAAWSTQPARGDRNLPSHRTARQPSGYSADSSRAARQLRRRRTDRGRRVQVRTVAPGATVAELVTVGGRLVVVIDGAIDDADVAAARGALQARLAMCVFLC
jgi:hypothetical protein